MPQIGYIAPNQELAEIAKNVFEQKNIKALIEVGAIESGAEKAEKLIQEGVKLIISRGGTSQKIRKMLNVPVIDIKITIEDIVTAIEQASRLGQRIAIVGFYNLLEGLESLNLLMNFDLRQIYIENEDDAFEKIKQAKNEGIDVLIGGVLQCEIAESLNLNSVFLKSGYQAVYNAYKEAKVVLETLLKEQQRVEEIHNVLDLARDGFLAIDQEGYITLINPVAAKVMNCNANTSVGLLLKKICPNLKDLEIVLNTGKEYLNDIISLGSTTMLYNRRPIILDNQIVGAVATLQDINIVQEAESNIRRKIYSKGLFARYHFSDIKGKSKKIKQSIERAQKFASTDSTLLITGESGTGKELFAQSIHNASARCNGPFVAVNCASFPENILESELFGYVEGAFTGARKKGKLGLFELAHEGTIFLDEISEISLVLQGRLLRVLQERTVRRLGDDKIIPINVRVIAATNKDLVELVNEKQFREDLYFRINILRLHLPSLRERKEDIPILANGFMDGYKQSSTKLSFSKDDLELLESYSWPGNVREIRNLMERIVILSESSNVDSKIIRNFIDENKYLFDIRKEEEPINIEDIEQVLKYVNNNKTKAAEILGIHRSTLWRILKNKNNQ